MAEFAGTPQQIDGEGCICLESCVLQVKRMWTTEREDKVLVGFQIQFIKEGEEHWRTLLEQARSPILGERKAA